MLYAISFNWNKYSKKYSISLSVLILTNLFSNDECSVLFLSQKFIFFTSKYKLNLIKIYKKKQKNSLYFTNWVSSLKG